MCAFKMVCEKHPDSQLKAFFPQDFLQNIRTPSLNRQEIKKKVKKFPEIHPCGQLI